MSTGSFGRTGTASSAGMFRIMFSGEIPSLTAPEWIVQNGRFSVPRRKYSITAVERERTVPEAMSSTCSWQN